jgi:hypothetical protein
VCVVNAAVHPGDIDWLRSLDESLPCALSQHVPVPDARCGFPWFFPTAVPQVTLTGRFAFVEFRMPEYATAALQLNGQIALMGNTLKIARPSSYVEPSKVCEHAAMICAGGNSMLVGHCVYDAAL